MEKTPLEGGQPLPRRGAAHLRSIVPFLKPYRYLIAAAALALVVTAFATLSLGQGLRYAIDNSSGSGATAFLEESVFLFGLLAIVLVLGSFMRSWLVSWIGERISADLRIKVFEHLISLDAAFFENHSSGDIQSRLTTDVMLLQTVIGSSFSIAIRSIILCLGAMALMFYTNFKLSIIVFLAIPLILLPTILLGRKIRGLSRENQEKLSDVAGYINEIIRNIKIIKANLHEKEDINRFNRHVGESFKVAAKRVKFRSLLISLVMFAALMAMIGMFWIGGQDVLKQAITPGELIAFIFYAFMATLSVAAISEVYGDLQRAGGAIDRLLELLAVKPKIIEPRKVTILPSSYSSILAFDQVSHRYLSRPEQSVLNKVSFSVHPNEHVALVGPSGAGKSTIFELILRFYDPTEGAVNLFDANIRNLSYEQLRGHIAIVPQKPMLFSGTIQENIAYAKPDAKISEIMQAAEVSHVIEFSDRLPKGLDTLVGEDGVLLSGGQCQRIAIARAILKKPKLLLLDEATSSLDADNENAIQQALEKLIAETTTLVIAHRLSTIRQAERILLFNQGNLIAEGCHQVLIEQNQFYAQLAELQFNMANPQTIKGTGSQPAVN